MRKPLRSWSAPSMSDSTWSTMLPKPTKGVRRSSGLYCRLVSPPTLESGREGTPRAASPALSISAHHSAGDGGHRLQAPLPGVAPGVPVDVVEASRHVHDPV